MKNNPLITIRLKADKAFKLNVGPSMVDSANNEIAYDYPDSVKGDGVYRIYTFNFAKKFVNKYDSTKIDKFYLNFNAGPGSKYAGNVTFDYIKIGDAALNTGIIETNKTNTLLSVYPNPATGLISIKNVSNENLKSITIMDIKGQTVKLINSFENGFINIESLSKGIYIVRVFNKDNTINNLKFIKQ